VVVCKSHCCTNKPVLGILRLTISGSAENLLSSAAAFPSALPCLVQPIQAMQRIWKELQLCSIGGQISCQYSSRVQGVGMQEKRGSSLLEKISPYLTVINSESKNLHEQTPSVCVWSLTAGRKSGFCTHFHELGSRERQSGCA